MADEIGFGGTFVSPEQEATYREYRLADHAARAERIVLFGQLGHFFALNDYRIYGATRPFWILVGMRAVFALGSVVVWRIFRRPLTPRRFDATLLSCILAIAALTLYVDATRPPGFMAHTIITVVLVLACYTIVPEPLSLQAVPATLMSVGSIALLVWAHGVRDPVVTTILTTLALVNAIGVATSRRLQHWDRRQFAALAREAKIREELVVSTDRRMRLEEQLRQARKMEAIGRLVGGVAHDFNNLLTTILGNAELLDTSWPGDQPGRSEIQDIRAAGERASRLIAQLMVFSRHQRFALQTLDLNTVVRDLERMLARLIGEHIRLRVVLHPELRCVQADAGQTEQVLVNLVVNARDAMQDGGDLTIETANVAFDGNAIAIHPEAQPGRYVLLSVRDTGQGMDAATREHIFEPFFTTKPVGRGTGLGLATVYGIVKQSGGHIVVESAPGRGSRFDVYLPVSDAEDAPRVPQSESEELPRGTETILLVEDDPSVRTLAERVLEAQGYRVVSATNGVEALARWDGLADPVALLVTDVVMPELGGRALAAALRARAPRLKVLYMSGYTTDLSGGPGNLATGGSFLQKPFTVGTLARAVRDALDQSVRPYVAS